MLTAPATTTTMRAIRTRAWLVCVVLAVASTGAAASSSIARPAGELEPADWLALYNRGVAHRKAGDNSNAIADYGAAIQINPGFIPAWNGRGVARQAEGDQEGAIADFGAALDLNPRSWVVLNNRGVSWRALGDTDRAIADFTLALDANPRYAIALVNRGATWRSLNDRKRAREDLDAAIGLDPALGMAYFNRGVLELSENRLDRAASDLEAAAARQSDGYAPLWLFLVRIRAGEEAGPGLDSAISRFAPSEWPAAIARHLLGRSGSEELFDAAASSSPKVRQARQCEAQFFAAEKLLVEHDSGAAFGLFRKAVESCPTDFIEYDHALVELARLRCPSGRSTQDPSIVPLKETCR